MGPTSNEPSDSLADTGVLERSAYRIGRRVKDVS
jgi:hypothetical protein